MRLIDADALIESMHENPPSYDMDRVYIAIDNAPTIALSENGITFTWTPDADDWFKEVAERALDEFEYKGRTIREWVEIVMHLPEPPKGANGNAAEGNKR